ncbi:hypothetical protein BDV26DRAFT_3142 [Aspergillus bertholletiae]|uniref:RING-type domain-containing protein n=1 Tax=Aspergillus bertholletiae TaxID=1226010 RepID=A0A5N7BQW6_9EURO|nr:hypothetical protein BDV26DRAFT_3142 [Aspergillus bertholletiae]
MAQYYLHMPSPTERGGFTKQELVLAPMPCYFGSKDWMVSLPCALPKECELCLEQLGPDSAYRTLPCKHIFHLPCIDCWLCTEDASCPLCRRKFYEYRRPRKIRTLRSNPSADEVSHRCDVSLRGIKLWFRQRLSTH